MAYEDPYRKNVLSSRILSLTGKNERNDNATWQVEYKGDKVVITVFTGLREAPRKGVMSTRISLNHWYHFMMLLEEVIKDPNPSGYVLEVRGPKQGGTYKDPSILYAKLQTGRDSEGIVYLTMFQENAPMPIKFPITEDKNLTITDKQGNKIDSRKMSDIFAKSYLQQGLQVIAALAATEYVEAEKLPTTNNRNKQSYNNSYSNNSNGTTSNVDSLF